MTKVHEFESENLYNRKLTFRNIEILQERPNIKQIVQFSSWHAKICAVWKVSRFSCSRVFRGRLRYGTSAAVSNKPKRFFLLQILNKHFDKKATCWNRGKKRTSSGWLCEKIDNIFECIWLFFERDVLWDACEVVNGPVLLKGMVVEVERYLIWSVDGWMI